MDVETLWNGLVWPLLRLTASVSAGLFFALLIESLNWTHAVAKVASPLIRLARLKDISGASFSMAFFSGLAANTMLSENYEQGKLTQKELILSNLFNSLPTFFLHVPTIFFITLPFIGGAAVLYVGLTLFSAILRTGFIILLGRVTLPPLPEGCVTCVLDEQKVKTWRQAVDVTWKRFKKRIRRILIYTIPIYIVFFFAGQYGFFKWLQVFMSENVGFLSFMPPEALGIVVFHIAAEFTAGLAAAGALLNQGGLAAQDIVLALLVGNVLSTPMRAFRHQFPYYAGIFKPKMAMRLIAYNQLLRAASVLLVTVLFYLWGEQLVALIGG